MHSRIAGTGAYLPAHVLTNADLARRIDTSDEWVRSRTGICERRIVGAEIYSRILDWNDRGTCVLFGDGAGAVVLVPASTPGVLSSHLHADGNYRNILAVPGTISGGEIRGTPFLTMDGGAVFKFAVK